MLDNNQEVFADGIGEISLSGGMVRLDLVSLVGSQNEADKKPTYKVKGRVVMPPEGFLRSFSAMENLVKQLMEAGLVRPRDNADGMGQGAVPGRGGAAAPPKSPNF